MSHYTVSDKDRAVTLSADGKWHAFSIKDKDGKVKQSIKPEAGVYILMYSLLGRVVMKTTSIMQVRGQRYPIDPEDGGTAWDTVDLFNNPTSTWVKTGVVKVEIFPGGDYSRGAGLDYRFKGGKLECSQRILKFIRQRDD